MMSFRTVTAALLALGATAAVRQSRRDHQRDRSDDELHDAGLLSPQAHEWKFFHAGVGEHGTKKPARVPALLVRADHHPQGLGHG